ncbi:MAG: aldehyde dehydrogenase family protein, partial [Pseudomonadota bacterium]
RLTLGTRDDAVSAMADQMVAQCRHHDADDRRHPDLLTLTDPAELISLLEAGDMNSDAGITPQHAAAGRWSRCTEARLAGMMERARADVARINAKNIADRDRDAPTVGDRLVLAMPSPNDRQSTASVVQMTDAADVGSIVDVGVQAFAGWNATGLTERARIAATFANLLERRQDELIAAMVLSGGMRIVDAHADWQGAISDAREMIANVLDARASSPTDRAATGLGLMLVVPDATSLRSRVRLEVAALMAGNSVISATLPTAARLADLVRDLWGEAQLGEAQLQIVHVDASTLTRFGCDAGIAGFASATGESTLQRVMSARAMASVTSIPALDLSAPIAVAIHDGTVDPGLVIADLSRALGASQSETGWPVRKVFVDDGQFEPICKALATAAFRAVPGPSWLAETTVGPLPTREDLDAALADKVRLADTCTVVADPADTTYGDGFHCMPGVYAAERGSGARPAVGGPLIVVEPFDATDLDDLVANVRRVSDNAALALYSAGHGLSQALADELQPVALAHTTGASPVAGNTTLGSAVIRSRATRTPNARGCPDPLSLPFSRSVRPIIVD